MSLAGSTLPNLEQFDCEGDPTSVGSRWEKWKRALEIYLIATNVDTPVKKRATLLHLGGLTLQEIYYNLPGAQADVNDSGDRDGEAPVEVDVYKVALDKLDNIFAPKQSYIYERYLFGLMKQEDDEKFERFLVKLRHQAEKCNFKDKDERLIDQITGKCRSVELRKKILEVGDSITLDEVVAKANALEVVIRQLQQFKSGNCGQSGDNKLEVNKIDITKNKKKIVRRQWSLAADSTKCEVDYIFNLDEDSTITCNIGGVDIEMLIDSGSKCDIITDTTWNHLKKNKVQVTNQNPKPEKVLLPYGGNEPLDIMGSFDTEICVNKNTKKATVYVIKDGTRNLLGKSSAISLGVLRIGLQINSVNTEEPKVVFPKFKDVTLHIPINETVQPVIQPYRRVPIPLEEKVSKKLEELKRADIIEEVHEPSPWVSPMVPVIKEDGEVRICLDMRRANVAIIRENHPLPTMNELLPNFKQARYFSKLDIRNAFHQLEIAENCRYITTFSTSKGLFRYKRLMFGISCAPEMFQKILEKILLGCAGTFNFIDDIIIHVSTEKEHDDRLVNVLKVLKENNVLLNNKKCIYKVDKIEFLGHELSKNGVRPLAKYITAIQTSRKPNSTEEIQSFLGLVNFVSKWIPNLATLTEPLRELLRLGLGKAANIQKYWTKKQDIAFQTLKHSLSNIQTLGYYDTADKTQVIADASPVGLGAVLVQINDSGPRVIAYGHKALTDCEKRYCQTEKEALALVWAVEHFRIYLLGKDFELISDHKPLETIFGPNSRPCARIERVTNIFLVNLSTADLLVTGLCMPIQLSKAITLVWFYGETVCKIVNYMQGVAVAASVFTIAAMSVDRWLSISPEPRLRPPSRRQAVLLLLLLWCAAMLIFIPILMVATVQKETLPVIAQALLANISVETRDVHFCTEEWPDIDTRQKFGMFSFTIVYAIPGSITILSYTFMGRTLCSVRPPFDIDEGNVSMQQGLRLMKERKRVAWILLLLAVLFALCWLPYNIMQLLLDLNAVDAKDLSMYLPFALLLGHANSAINPIVYCIMTRNFQRSARKLLCGKGVCKQAKFTWRCTRKPEGSSSDYDLYHEPHKRCYLQMNTFRHNGHPHMHGLDIRNTQLSHVTRSSRRTAPAHALSAEMLQRHARQDLKR